MIKCARLKESFTSPLLFSSSIFKCMLTDKEVTSLLNCSVFLITDAVCKNLTPERPA